MGWHRWGQVTVWSSVSGIKFEMLIKHCDRGNKIYETGTQVKDLSWRNKFGSLQGMDIKLHSSCFADKYFEH